MSKNKEWLMAARHRWANAGDDWQQLRWLRPGGFTQAFLVSLDTYQVIFSEYLVWMLLEQTMSVVQIRYISDCRWHLKSGPLKEAA